MSEIICPFNASEEYGKQIASPVLCSPADNNACRAADSTYYLNGAFSCCFQTAEKILEIKGSQIIVLGVLKKIEDSTLDAGKPHQKEANELRARGIRNALAEAGHISTLPIE